jgi:hypothetical protein
MNYAYRVGRYERSHSVSKMMYCDASLGMGVSSLWRRSVLKCGEGGGPTPLQYMLLLSTSINCCILSRSNLATRSRHQSKDARVEKWASDRPVVAADSPRNNRAAARR